MILRKGHLLCTDSSSRWGSLSMDRRGQRGATGSLWWFITVTLLYACNSRWVAEAMLQGKRQSEKLWHLEAFCYMQYSWFSFLKELVKLRRTVHQQCGSLSIFQISTVTENEKLFYWFQWVQVPTQRITKAFKHFKESWLQSVRLALFYISDELLSLFLFVFFDNSHTGVNHANLQCH